MQGKYNDLAIINPLERMKQGSFVRRRQASFQPFSTTQGHNDRCIIVNRQLKMASAVSALFPVSQNNESDKM
jgi:hypothetical protein